MIGSKYNVSEHELIIDFYKLKESKERKDYEFKINDNFEVKLNNFNTDIIFNEICRLDGTIEYLFEENNSFLWKIPLPFGVRSTRFMKLLPLMIEDISLPKKLKNYQKEGVNWLKNADERILADDMGLGKSLQVIKSILDLTKDQKINNFLIICPSTLVENWRREFIKWAPYLSIGYFSSKNLKNKKQIFSAIKENNGIVINYEQLGNLNKLLDNNFFDLVVADESHKLRNISSKTHNEFCKIGANKRWLITGTPFERNRDDLVGILKCLNKQNVSLFNSKTSDLFLKSGLKDRILRRMKIDVLSELPSVNKKIEILEMKELQKKEYNKYISKITSTPPEERIGFIPKLLNIATMSSDGVSSKIDRTLEILEKTIFEKRKAVIFSYFNNPLHQIQKVLNKTGISSEILIGDVSYEDRSRIINLFQDENKFDVLLCNGKVAGEGINLTKASVVIFINEAWNPSANRQAEDRVNRMGQENDIDIYYLRSAYSIDENLTNILRDKSTKELEFLKKV